MQQNCLLGDTVPDTLPTETKGTETVSEDEGEHEAGPSKLIQLDQDDSEEEVEGGEEVLDGSYVPTAAEIVAQEALEKTLESYDDLQLAWEVLDMSRVIYSKQPSDKANDLRLAEVNIALGDVSLESEQFDIAVSDYKSALSLKMHWLEPSDRTIAELYYKIGCAYELDKKISDAMEHVGRCLELLQSRGELLEKQNNNDQDRMDELADLKSLYPDLEAKLEDLKSILNTQEDEQVQPSKAPVTSPSVVHDVTSLIKRKHQASVAAKTQVSGDFDLSEPIKRVKKDSSLNH
jgi:tetratricopeptide (TPR) repeat protein